MGQKTINLLALILFTISTAFAQSDDLVFNRDRLSGEITSSRYLEISDRSGEIRFDLSGSGTVDGTKLNGIYVQLYGSGQCNGDNTMVFLTNKDRLTLHSTNKMNCKGLAYFPIDENARRILMNYRIGKIIFYNGRNRNPLTNVIRGRVQRKDVEYFIEMYYAIDNVIFSNKE